MLQYNIWYMLYSKYSRNISVEIAKDGALIAPSLYQNINSLTYYDIYYIHYSFITRSSDWVLWFVLMFCIVVVTWCAGMLVYILAVSKEHIFMFFLTFYTL
jgi:hypothetical protein